MAKRIISLFFIAFYFFSIPVFAFADTCDPVNPTQWFTCVINNVLNFVVWPIFVGVVIIMFLWAGILFLTGRGDPAKLEIAKKEAEIAAAKSAKPADPAKK